MKIKNIFQILCIFSFLTYLFASINVSKKITKNDVETIKKLKVKKFCSNINSFKEEINCISKVQESIIKIVTKKNCRKGFINSEPFDFVRDNYGCCFDRARFIEKTLTYYGFKNRRVFIISSEKLGIFAFLVPSNTIVPISNHAVTEVKTSKGWLGVDSYTKFIAIDENLNPYTFRNLQKSKIKFPNMTVFKNKTYNVIGLYSRKGNYHKPYIPLLPELNFKDFLFNFKI